MAQCKSRLPVRTDEIIPLAIVYLFEEGVWIVQDTETGWESLTTFKTAGGALTLARGFIARQKSKGANWWRSRRRNT